MQPRNFLIVSADGMTQVRDQAGRLLGAIPLELTSDQTVVMGTNGERFFVMTAAMGCIRVGTDQDPHHLPGFIPVLAAPETEPESTDPHIP